MGSDTLLVLQRNANGNRTSRATASLELGGMARSLTGVGRGEGEPDGTALVLLLDAMDPVFISRQGGISARFFREPVSPGAGFQFGWGGQDALRFLDGDTASIFTGHTTWTGGTGVRLPSQPQGLRELLRVQNRDSPPAQRQGSLDPILARSEGDTGSGSSSGGGQEGPRIPVRLLGLSKEPDGDDLRGPGPSAAVQRGVADPCGCERHLGRSGDDPLPGELFHGRGGRSDRRDSDPDGTRMRFFVSSSLAEPPLLGSRLDGPLRLSLGYQYSSELNCRVPQGRADCVAYVDFLNRSVNLTLDTVILPLEVGLHLTYTNRRSFVGQHDGSTQFQLGFFGQFLFNSGTFVPPSTSSSPGGF